MTLTAISSHRPLVQSEQVAKNQIRAKRSWDGVFDQVIYFGDREEQLAGPKTTFVHSPQFPFMSVLFLAASMCSGVSCIINADIVVTQALKSGIASAISLGAEAMTSQRYEFDPVKGDLTAGRIVDLGIDFFAATPHVWSNAAIRVPNELRIGHNKWDSWLSSYFNMSLKDRFVSLSKFRCIFHPKHGDRHQPHEIKFTHDYWSERPGFPRAI